MRSRLCVKCGNKRVQNEIFPSTSFFQITLEPQASTSKQPEAVSFTSAAQQLYWKALIQMNDSSTELNYTQ